MSKALFGTDGIRGPAGMHPITYEGAVRMGRSAVELAWTLGGKRVVVAGDTRPSTPELVDGVLAGVTGVGGTAVLAGTQPTAAVAIGIAAGHAEVGVQVTASHNPAGDNGFKVFGANGRKLDDEQARVFEGWLREPVDENTASGRLVDGDAIIHQAWADAAAHVLPDLERLSGLPIALDLANGAATRCAAWARSRVPAVWSTIGEGEGRINDKVGSNNPRAIAQIVQAGRCIGGIAVDGDGDRCVLVDEHGQVVAGDALAWLLATRMGVKHLVVTQMSNAALEASLPGVLVHRVPVGDRHLREAMDAHGWPLGCEESGHVLFHDLAGGDGLITGLRALCLLERDERLSEAIRGFQPLPRKVAKVQVNRRPDLDGVASIVEAKRLATERLGSGGRVFLRYSGTEPVLRILVEGRASAVEAAAETLAAAAMKALT